MFENIVESKCSMALFDKLRWRKLADTSVRAKENYQNTIYFVDLKSK